MSTAFVIDLYDDRHHTRLDQIIQFIGEDDSGWFGIKAHHQHFMTSLRTGLARLQHDDAHWEYLAFPGALLRFENNILTLVTRRFWRHDNVEHIRQVLSDNLQQEQQSSIQLRQSLAHMEENMLRRIQELQKQQSP